MGELKTYVRRLPILVQARELEFDEIVYDWHGVALPHYPGDMLIHANGINSVMSRRLFDLLYTEEPHGQSEHENVSQTLPSDL